MVEGYFRAVAGLIAVLTQTTSFGSAILTAVPEETPAPPPEETTPPPRRALRRSAAETLRSTEFPAAMRGYDRAAVDQWRDEAADLVERLEQQQPRDSAVRHALDEVGRETAAILQSAHDSAAEIEQRSHARAEGRLRRAEREAEAAIRETEGHAERLEADTRELWEERSRLIEEIRQLADEVLGVADDALDRLQPPAGLSRGEPDSGGIPQGGAVPIDLSPGEESGVADPTAPAEDPTLEDPAEDPTLEDPSEDPTLEDEPMLGADPSEDPALEGEAELGEEPELESAAERPTLAEPPGSPEPLVSPGQQSPSQADEDVTVEAPVVDPGEPGQAR